MGSRLYGPVAERSTEYRLSQSRVLYKGRCLLQYASINHFYPILCIRMSFTVLARRGWNAPQKFQHFLTLQSSRTVVTWAEQDNWEDPRGPLGVDRPSPKLAPLTPNSPSWLKDLHNNGVCPPKSLIQGEHDTNYMISGHWLSRPFQKNEHSNTPKREKNGSRDSIWDTSATTNQLGSPRISLNTAMVDSSTS